MKKVLFLLIALFTLCATIEANAAPTETTDKRPKNGYNYKKAKRQAKIYKATNRAKILRDNGGCGWMNR